MKIPNRILLLSLKQKWNTYYATYAPTVSRGFYMDNGYQQNEQSKRRFNLISFQNIFI